MEFKELLEIAKNLKANNESNIRDYLEKIIAFDESQESAFNVLINNEIDIVRAVEVVYNEDFFIYDNFIEYIDSYIQEQINLPDFIELDYMAMWYRTFRYDDGLYINWVEDEWSKGHNEYGTRDEQLKEEKHVSYNLENSKLVLLY